LITVFEGVGFEHPSPSGDRFLLVAPLWREGDHYRAILDVYGVYGTNGLALSGRTMTGAVTGGAAGAPARLGCPATDCAAACLGTIRGALTVSDISQDCPPWVIPEFPLPPRWALPDSGRLGFPYPSGDHFLLVAPLWREDDHYRVILGAYNVRKLALPRGVMVYRALVPNGVKWGWVESRRQAIPAGPWSPVRYSLRKSDGLLYLEPSRVIGRTFVVEASLPTRDGWIEVVLSPGSWVVALGWTLDFNVLTLDGEVLFRGRHPYDEVEYDLPGGVHLAFWCHLYALDLSGDSEARWRKVSRLLTGGDLPKTFQPKWQYERRLFYGYCTVIEVRTNEPLLLEFRAPRPGAPLRSPTDLVTKHVFVTERYVRSHWLPPPYPHLQGSRGTPLGLLLVLHSLSSPL
jgi:hypothetical protein